MAVSLGLSDNARKQVAESLGPILADHYLLTLKTQNFHWNVTGPNFQGLHSLFGTQYEALFAAVDEIAERIRALGFPAPGGFAAYGKVAKPGARCANSWQPTMTTWWPAADRCATLPRAWAMPRPAT